MKIEQFIDHQVIKLQHDLYCQTWIKKENLSAISYISQLVQELYFYGFAVGENNSLLKKMVLIRAEQLNGVLNDNKWVIKNNKSAYHFVKIIIQDMIKMNIIDKKVLNND